MKRRLGILFLISCMALSMGGCGNAIPDMTDEQMDVIGEYAAITWLKYDANNRSRLVDLSEYEEKAEETITQPEVQEPSQESEEPGSIGNPEYAENEKEPVIVEPVIATMEEVLALPAGVTVTYQGMDICDSYPEEQAEDSFFYLEASAGKKLAVLKFLVDNQSAAIQDVDFLHSENVYRLKAEDNYVRNALTTMLLDDMVSYIGTLQPGDTQELVLLFEVDEQYTGQSLNFTIKNGENSYTIPVK